MTPTGLEMLEPVKAMAEAANQLSLASAGHSQKLQGKVSISAMEVVATFILPKIMQKFKIKEPGIQLEIISSDSTADLKRREADIAIRNAKPKQPDLIAKKLPESCAYLYASKKYLKRFGGSIHESKTQEADIIGFPAPVESILQQLAFLGFKGNPDKMQFVGESLVTHWALCKADLGVAIMFDKIGDKDPELARISESTKPIPVTTWLVAHRELQTSLKIRRVFDFLDAELTKVLSES